MRVFLGCLGFSRYSTVLSPKGRPHYRAQLGDVRFYRWLNSIGITPRKSLTLGAIDVPSAYFLDLVRGLLDGDGSVVNYTHNPIRSADPLYRYERLQVLFHSASSGHLAWLREGLTARLDIKGALMVRRCLPGRHPVYVLKYGKHASIRLLCELYGDPGAPRLERKWATWERFRSRYSMATLARPAGAEGRSYTSLSRWSEPRALEGDPTDGAGGGTRTLTGLRPGDFESPSVTDYDTPAHRRL